MSKTIKETHQFMLVLACVADDTANLEDLLFKGNCSDALIHFRNKAVFLDFTRDAENFETAVISAVNDVENALPNAIVTSVAPDNFVSEAYIAKRINTKRQTVSLWVKGARKSNIPFPKPVLKLTEKSPLWNWHEIAQWLYDQDIIEDINVVKNAEFIKDLNSILIDRAQSTPKAKKHILNQLIYKQPKKAA